MKSPIRNTGNRPNTERFILGQLIVIEGIDGAGKSTIADELRLYCLRRPGVRNVQIVRFPQYAATQHGKLVGRYLNGEFGDLATVNPWLSAQLYAGDRREYLPTLSRALMSNEVVICDRYVYSNVAYHLAKLTTHHAAKTDELEALREFIYWLEFDQNHLPQPTATCVLDTPLKFAVKNMDAKKARNYTDKQRDLHEADMTYLEQVRRQFLQLADDNELLRFDTVANDMLRPPAFIAASICDVVFA